LPAGVGGGTRRGECGRHGAEACSCFRRRRLARVSGARSAAPRRKMGAEPPIARRRLLAPSGTFPARKRTRCVRAAPTTCILRIPDLGSTMVAGAARGAATALPDLARARFAAHALAILRLATVCGSRAVAARHGSRNAAGGRAARGKFSRALIGVGGGGHGWAARCVALAVRTSAVGAPEVSAGAPSRWGTTIRVLRFRGGPSEGPVPFPCPLSPAEPVAAAFHIRRRSCGSRPGKALRAHHAGSAARERERGRAALAADGVFLAAIGVGAPIGSSDPPA